MMIQNQHPFIIVDDEKKGNAFPVSFWEKKANEKRESPLSGRADAPGRGISRFAFCWFFTA